jgi:hypothetical protein
MSESLVLHQTLAKKGQSLQGNTVQLGGVAQPGARGDGDAKLGISPRSKICYSWQN